MLLAHNNMKFTKPIIEFQQTSKLFKIDNNVPNRIEMFKRQILFKII